MTADRPDTPPEWFRVAIVGGLQYLYALRLAGTPGADTIEATGRAWVRALWRANIGWHMDLDTARIAEAFDLLAMSRTEWPTPKHLRDAMPARQPPPALPAPDLTPAQVQANLARMRAALSQIGNRDEQTRTDGPDSHRRPPPARH